MSSFSPVLGSVPGWIGPSDMMMAGWLCSSSAASVPTGGLSQATTAIVPARPGASRGSPQAAGGVLRPVRAQRVVRDLAADQRVAHLTGAVADAVRGGDRVFRLHQAKPKLIRALAD